MNSKELYEKIIDSLAKESGAITNVVWLLKQLYDNLDEATPEFVRKELSGYSADDTLPPYRVIPSMRIYSDSQFIMGGIDCHRSVPVSLQETYLEKTEKDYRYCRGPLCEYQELYAQGEAQTVVEALNDFETDDTTYKNVRVECRSADMAKLLNAVKVLVDESIHNIARRHPDLRSPDRQLVDQSTNTYIAVSGSNNQVAADNGGVAQTQDNQMR